jgi:hypothetical protein
VVLVLDVLLVHIVGLDMRRIKKKRTRLLISY